MSLLPHRAALRILAISAVALLLDQRGTALSYANADANPESECVSAAIADIALEELADVDEIRVKLAASSPTRAASLVTVATEDSDRIVEMNNQAYKSIHFAPAMSSDEFRISLFPTSLDKAPACVESVELLSKGGSVFVFKP